MKYCPKCKETKPFTDFYQRKNVKREYERFHAYCKPCTLARIKYWREHEGGREKIAQRNKEWRKNNLEESKRRHREWNWNSKIKALNAYGGICACCGEKEPKFLAIDHINNDGNKHRREVKNKTIYVWLRDNNYPKGFQVLCHNCNMAKAFWKICPHKI